MLADVPFYHSNEQIQPVGQFCNFAFRSFQGVAEPADLLLMLRLLFTHLVHVDAKPGLLLKDELHGAAHFLVGHVLPFRELWLKDTTPLIVSPERRLFH